MYNPVDTTQAIQRHGCLSRVTCMSWARLDLQKPRWWTWLPWDCFVQGLTSSTQCSALHSDGAMGQWKQGSVQAWI